MGVTKVELFQLECSACNKTGKPVQVPMEFRNDNYREREDYVRFNSLIDGWRTLSLYGPDGIVYDLCPECVAKVRAQME